MLQMDSTQFLLCDNIPQLRHVLTLYMMRVDKAPELTNHLITLPSSYLTPRHKKVVAVLTSVCVRTCAGDLLRGCVQGSRAA